MNDFTYTNNIDLRHSSDTNKELLSPVWVKTKTLNATYGLPAYQYIVWQIPAGFRSDGASIPPFLWWWVPPTAWWILLPAIAHDWCWRKGYIDAHIYDDNMGQIVDSLGVIDITLKQGTEIMFEKMSDFYGGLIDRYLVYITLEIVRLVNNKK